MNDLMTPAPEIAIPADYVPTGNLQVHLPANRTYDATIERLGVVHLGVDGVLDLVAPEGVPLLRPILLVNGTPQLPYKVKHEQYWIPVWCYRSDAYKASLTLLAPISERGFVIQVECHFRQEIEIEFYLEASLYGLEAVRFRGQPLEVPLRRYQDPWTRSVVWETSSIVPLVALAANFEGDWSYEQVGDLDWIVRCKPTSEAPTRIYFGIAPESDGARTTALHLRRVGWHRLFNRTYSWLRDRIVKAPAGLETLTNRNLFFSYFFSQANTIDSGETVMLTSRSFIYYVSGAYWSRDSLLWAFPAVLKIDPPRARQLLLTAFGRYARHPGEHAQYLSGEVLYPGFELDEAAAYPLALARYLKATGEKELASEPVVKMGLDHTLRTIQSQKHPKLELYRTFLSPTDDPVSDTPYLAYDNFLLASALKLLGSVLENDFLVSWGNQIEKDAKVFFRIKGPKGNMYAFAMDEQGAFLLNDEPAGSLLLLPHLGMCSLDDPIWRATADWIRSGANPFHYVGVFSGRGSAHFRYPSVFGLVNDLLSDNASEALEVLRLARLDNGIACEGFDVNTGVVKTGGAFASLAGWLAWALSTHG